MSHVRVLGCDAQHNVIASEALQNTSSNSQWLKNYRARRRRGSERSLIHSLVIPTIRLSQWSSPDNRVLLITVPQDMHYPERCCKLPHYSSGYWPITRTSPPQRHLTSYEAPGYHYCRQQSTGSRLCLAYWKEKTVVCPEMVRCTKSCHPLKTITEKTECKKPIFSVFYESCEGKDTKEHLSSHL